MGLLAGSSTVLRPFSNTNLLELMHFVYAFFFFLKLLVWNETKCILHCILPACCSSFNFKSYALRIKYN